MHDLPALVILFYTAWLLKLLALIGQPYVYQAWESEAKAPSS